MSLRYRIQSFFMKFSRNYKIDPPPYRHIVQIGDPILRYKADKVPISEIKSPEIVKIIKIMKETMELYNTVGLAAPQIGVGKRIIAFQYPDLKNSAYDPESYKRMEMEKVDLNVWINPEMRILDYSKVSHPEGCASLKGLFADVPRYKKVALKGFGEEGEEKILEASGWTARIIQHEMDHINGAFYVDIMDPKTLCTSGWQYINIMKGRVTHHYGPIDLK